MIAAVSASSAKETRGHTRGIAPPAPRYPGRSSRGKEGVKLARFLSVYAQQQEARQQQLDQEETAHPGDMAPILHVDSQQAHHAPWAPDGRQQARPGGPYGPHQHPHQHPHQWAGGQMHINPMVLTRDPLEDGGLPAPVHGIGAGRLPQGSMGRELLGEGSFMGRGYSIKRCQGFVRCDMDIDAEVVGWVIGKNGESVLLGRRERDTKERKKIGLLFSFLFFCIFCIVSCVLCFPCLALFRAMAIV